MCKKKIYWRIGYINLNKLAAWFVAHEVLGDSKNYANTFSVFSTPSGVSAHVSGKAKGVAERGSRTKGWKEGGPAEGRKKKSDLGQSSPFSFKFVGRGQVILQLVSTFKKNMLTASLRVSISKQ